MHCSLIWKLHFNPSLQESDEVLSACLGTLVLFLLLLVFPLTSSVVSLSSTSDQREKERDTRMQELRQQREKQSQKGRSGPGAGEVVIRKVEKSADGSTLSQVTKTNRFAQSGSFFLILHSTSFESVWRTQATMNKGDILCKINFLAIKCILCVLSL